MPKSKDTREKRKVTVMLPVEDLAAIQGKTNETDTKLMLRLVEQEAQRVSGAPSQLYISSEELRPLIRDILKEEGFARPAAPIKPAAKRRK